VKKRAAVRFLAFVCVMQIIGCGKQLAMSSESHHVSRNPIMRDTAAGIPASRDGLAFVDIDSTLTGYFAERRLRQFDHKTLPDQETVDCLYGVVHGDTAIVTMIRPAKIRMASADSVRYDRCPRPKADVFGTLRYLGVWHPHIPAEACWFSLPDSYSFEADPYALLDAMSCSRGLLVRGKK
jgi:hypothetical protein